MAQFEHLPIYRQSFNLLVEFHKLLPNFPKKYKFTIGSEIINDLTKGIVMIIQTNRKNEKSYLLEDLILLFEKVKLQIRLLKSLEVISKELYFNLSDKIIQILKQCERWRKQVK